VSSLGITKHIGGKSASIVFQRDVRVLYRAIEALTPTVLDQGQSHHFALSTASHLNHLIIVITYQMKLESIKVWRLRTIRLQDVTDAAAGRNLHQPYCGAVTDPESLSCHESTTGHANNISSQASTVVPLINHQTLRTP
jgi:hypothetical protein